MAIVQELCNSYKVELLQGIHSSSHEYYLALFTDSTTLDKNTTSYTGLTGEVANGNGYTTGGKKLESGVITLMNDVAILDFDDLTWGSSSFTSRGALVYNNSLAGKNAVGVLDFGQNYTSVNGDFKVVLPNPTDTEAILRVS